MKPDFYELLGVARTATVEEIRAAYKKAAFLAHPDRGGDEAKFKLIAEAHETLVDPQRRRVYDQTGGISLDDVDFVELLAPLGGRARQAAAVLGALVALAERASHATHLADILYDVGEKGVEASLYKFLENEHPDRMYVRAGIVAVLDYLNGGPGRSPLQEPARKKRGR